MSLQTVCRLCLSMNTPVRALDDGPLRDVYEKLTDISLITPHRPLVACLLCYCQLRKCHNLMVRSVRADEVLSHILDRGEVVTEDSIAMINWKAYQLKDLLSLTPIELIAIPSSGHNLMKATIKEEPVQSQFKEIDMDRCVENLKCEESEEEECVDRTALRKITKDRESVVLVDEQDVKSEELEGAMTFDNEGWTSEQDIDTAVLEDITMDIEKLAHVADRNHDILYEAENVKGEDMMHKVSEAAKDIESSESEGAAPAVKCKRTHTKTQDRTPGDQNITEKRRKQRTVEETESPNTNTNTGVSENTEEAAVSLQVSKNTSTCSNTATNRGNVTVGSDNESTSTNTDVDCRRSQHLRNTYICNDCGDMFDDKQLITQHIEHHDTDERRNGERSAQKCTATRRERFSKTSVKNKHIETRTRRRRLNDLCQRSFFKKLYLVHHMRKHTDRDKTFLCAICQRRFNRKNDLNRHLRKHIKEPFECAICRGRFSEKGTLKQHIRIHTKEKPFECAICQGRFSEKGSLKKHLRIHTQEKPFECVICQRSFTNKFNLNSHLRIHTKEKPFECAICQRAFTQKGHLNSHLKIHTKEKPFECAICQRAFTQKYNLNVHLRIHTKDKLFKCAICQRTFTHKGSLNTHLMIHTNEKPFECAICQRAFTRKCNLNVHLRIHTKDKPFKCAICQRTFIHKGNLNSHLKIHTNEKPFECAICQRTFTHKGSLNTHLKIHTNEKPFECAICQRAFTQKCNLNVHLRIHTKDKPFECAICQQTFTHKVSLNRHLKIHNI